MGDEPKMITATGPRRLLLLALLFALLAGAGTMLFLHVEERRIRAALAPKPKNMTEVVVAAQHLPAGSTVDIRSMAVRSVPTEYVGDDVLLPAEFNAVLGAVLTKDLGSGKMLTRSAIDLAIARDFAATVREGFRAVTIHVDEINSIAELIRPGNRIDLYVRLPESVDPRSADRGGVMVVPVLESVLVLATGKVGLRPSEDAFRTLTAEDRTRPYTTMTLEVTSGDAALLRVAEARGTLAAVLKNDKDTSAPSFSRVTMSDLFGHAAALRQAAENKLHNQQLDGVHRDEQGRLVTRDGVVLTDPGVTLNEQGLLVTKDGLVLSGRGLLVDSSGRIRDAKGNLIDIASLSAGKDDSLVDDQGNVLAGNGYRTTKGGFLIDQEGRILTPDGHVLSGVHLDADGTVRTDDGRVLAAADLTVAADGTVHVLTTTGEEQVLAGVGAEVVPDFARSFAAASATQPALAAARTYEVEYIVGGGGDGPARTFMVKVDE